MTDMAETSSFDFLNPGIQQVRKSIKGIDDSYNNEWDILAELLQNSVDAIRQEYRNNDEGEYKGIIDIVINADKREMTITDNGVGIAYEELPELLKPFSSGKETDSTTVGEKGVGLTFTLFSSNQFCVHTGDGRDSTIGKVSGALNWKNSVGDKPLNMEMFKSDEQIKGTSISISGMEELNLFDLNNAQMKYLIRTKTAIGNTDKIWNEDIDITVNYEYTDIQNKYHIDTLPFKYFNVIDELSTNNKVDLQEFLEKSSDTMISDKEKRVALKDKIAYKKGTFSHSGNRLINYLAYFVPNRNAWESLNKNFGLLPEEIDENQINNHIEEYYYAHLGSGIFTAVKGMPTGISINHPSTGNAGYWPNMFILFQDNKLSFDIGRKSIHGSQQNILKGYAKEIFNEFTKIMSRYGTRSLSSGGRNWERDNIFKSVNDMRSLGSNYTQSTVFQKSPNKQEAQVSAMFYEQIGRGNIKGLTLFTTGYKGKYDLYGMIDDKGNVVIEFKSELRNILKDFNDEQKLFDEIDIVVCWDVTELDEDKFHEHGISITNLGAPSIFSSSTEDIPNTTHRLELSGFTKPIYVIDMKLILEKISIN